MPEANSSYSMPLAQLLPTLNATAGGLSSPEANQRLKQFGRNELDGQPRHRLVLNFLSRFRNPLVLVLLGASVVAAMTGDPVSVGIIITVVMLSVLLDFIQERSAQNAADRLRQRVALRVGVLRDARAQVVAAAEIVPGDVVLLAAGDLVPADCRLIEAKDLFVNQALLTGESYPAEKSADDIDGTDTASVPANAVFMGSSVVSGSARAIVVTTARSTQMGAIARSLNRQPPPTAFSLGVRDFGLMIVRLTVFLVLFVLLINLAFHRPLLESLLFALALAVGLTPELLPMVVSVTLARGAIRMSTKQVIVKRLPAIHDLGSMDTLCSDKTGTLTEARISLVREIDLKGGDSKAVLSLAYLNAALETGLKSPLDEAILRTPGIDLDGWKKIDEVPFDFERRRVSVLAERDGHRRLVVKGAPEDVLKISSRYQCDGEDKSADLDAAARQEAQRVLDGLGDQGFRVLGVAWREVEPACSNVHVADESELTFAGFAAFLDPPKQSAQAALAALAELGVALKIVTGDNERVTLHLCQQLGIDVLGVLTGDELTKLGDDALLARLDRVNLFCRVTPSQKSRVIRALKRRGRVVGYLGDGINDAPSLYAADVGLSVDSAVDVAKEAAAMILLETDLGVLADGVREGRRTFANILKYVMMGTSSNFGNMFSMAGGVLLLPFLPMLPVQILLNNLLYDVSEIAIPMDNVDEEMVRRPHRWDMKFIRNFMFVFGPVSSLFDFATFALLLWVVHADESLFHTGWFVESMATQVLVIFVIRSSKSIFESRPHPLLATSSLIVVGAAVILPFTFVGTWFGFVPLPLSLLLALGALTVIYLLLVEVMKRTFLTVYRL